MADPSDDHGGDGWTADPRVCLDELIDDYRASLHDSLNGLSDDDARLRMVPSKTTLLGLIKHVTYVKMSAPTRRSAAARTLRSASPPRPIGPSR